MENKLEVVAQACHLNRGGKPKIGELQSRLT
jgi:hypothetical protein